MNKRNFLSLLIAAIVGVFMLATPNSAGAQPALGKIVGTVVDADGQRIFSDGDVDALAAKSTKALDRIADRAFALNRFTKEDLEAIAKN